jgi:drug/metabolite transporter (DMT)-like permease
MKNNRIMQIMGAIAVVFAASLWGLDGVVLRPRLYRLSVPVVVFLEHAIAFLFMLVFVLIVFLFVKNFPKEEWKEIVDLKSGDWLSFLWIGLFGGAIGTMAITKALFYVNFEHLSAIIILQKLQPLFAIVLAIILLGEKPKRELYLWAALALLGSYLITFSFNRPVFAGNRFFIASLLSLLAAFAWGSSTVFGKKVVSKVNYRVASYIRFGLTSLIVLSIITATNGFAGFNAVSGIEFKILLFVAFSTGFAAIFIYYFGLQRVMASKATIYELAFPVTAVVLDYIVNNNIMSAGQWLGAVLIVGSMIGITQSRAQGNKSF